MKPLCFVLMPFGTKPTTSGGSIHFNSIYSDLILPAIQAAGMEPLRADEEQAGGVIHKPMYERLLLCEFAIADLTMANANVFYELGIRHAVRRRSTVSLFAAGAGQLPFDVAPLRAVPYQLGPDGTPSHLDQDLNLIVERLTAARQDDTDSPLYQLVEDYPDVAHEKTDVFRDRVEYERGIKSQLREARTKGLEAIRSVEEGIGDLADAESGVAVDLFLSYRAVESWKDMIRLVDVMSKPMQRTVLIQEQLGFALNRAGRGPEAEVVLRELIASRGTSSETCGILGRVYKDRWEIAAKAGRTLEAEGHLDKAVEAYRNGFEADWRDAYPGVNAVTLMELANPDTEEERAALRLEQAELLPVVAYSVERRIKAGEPDYWDYATVLELSVLQRNDAKARKALGKALSLSRETWEPATTARNLRLIREARAARGEDEGAISEIEGELERRSS